MKQVAFIGALAASLATTASAAVPSTSTAQAAAGAESFVRHCAACHAPGRSHPGTLQLEMDRGLDKAYLLARKDLIPDYVKIVVRNGYRSMPPFRISEIGDAELSRLAAYVSSTPDPSRGAQ